MKYVANSTEELEGWARHGSKWLMELPSRLDRDLDCLIAITGEEGTGKSTLALHVGLTLDPNLWLDQIHNSAEALMGDAVDRPEATTLVLDEAFSGALNRDHATSGNKRFVQFLGEGRALRHFIVVAFPRFQNLDPYLRKHRVAYRIHVPKRGVAEAYEPQADKFGRRESYQELQSVFRFGPLEHRPIWPRYQKQKKARIRERNRDVARMGSSGLRVTEIQKAVDELYISPEQGAKEMVANGHVSNLDAAAIALAARLDMPPHCYHPTKGKDDEITPTGTAV